MMKMSLLAASILAATTGVAYAADNTSTYCKSGFYAGLQGGRGDTFYHGDDVFQQVQTNGAGTYSTTTTSNGQSRTITSYTATNNLSAQKVDDTGIAGRLFAGYQFNPYFALETGYTQWSKTDFSANVDTQRIYNSQAEQSYNTEDSYSSVSGDITEHAVDLVAKATLPLQMGFGLYAKAGMAYITASRSINQSGPTQYVYNYANAAGTSVTYNTPQSLNTTYTKTYQAFRPTYGAGINYTIPNTNMDMEVFYSEIAGSGAIPTASLWGAGVSYKFA